MIGQPVPRAFSCTRRTTPDWARTYSRFSLNGIFKSVISSSNGDSDDDMTLLKIWRNAVYASQTKILEGPSS